MPKYLVLDVVYRRRSQGRTQGRRHQAPEVAAKAVESLGGKLEALYFCFGQYRTP